MKRRLPLLVGALAFASLVGTASAGRFSGGVHFGGGAHFSAGHWGGGVHYGASVHVGGYGGYHWAARPGWGGYRGGSWGVHGRVWVGGYHPYYYYPSYYYYSYPYYTESVPSYYPVAPAYAGPSMTPAVLVQPPLPKLGIGLFAGAVGTQYNQDTNTSETDVGVLARYRLTDGLIIEGELGKISTSVTDPQTGATVDNARVDRRLGGTLIYEIGARNQFAPYILGGMGVEQASVNGNYNTTQDYAEVGAGVRLALSRNFHLTFDVRAGQRTSVSSPDMAQTLPPNTTASMVAPPASTSTNNAEDYTRARLSAILYF